MARYVATLQTLQTLANNMEVLTDVDRQGLDMGKDPKVSEHRLVRLHGCNSGFVVDS